MLTGVFRDTQPFHFSRLQLHFFADSIPSPVTAFSVLVLSAPRFACGRPACRHFVPRTLLAPRPPPHIGSLHSVVCMWATCLPPLRACTLLAPRPPPPHRDLTCPRAVFSHMGFSLCAPPRAHDPSSLGHCVAEHDVHHTMVHVGFPDAWLHGLVSFSFKIPEMPPNWFAPLAVSIAVAVLPVVGPRRVCIPLPSFAGKRLAQLYFVVHFGRQIRWP